MIRPQMTKASALLVTLLTAAACGALNQALTDAQNRLILSDVAGETTTEAAAGAATDIEETGEPPECRGNPIRENCADDATTFCAEFLPPSEEEVPTEERCGKTFEERRDKKRELLACLEENLESLSAGCQQAVGEGPPPRRPRRECRGRSLLRPCIADARTLCEAELPIPGEPDGFTKEERHERVKAIVSCLEGQLESVSAECKEAIEALPPKH